MQTACSAFTRFGWVLTAQCPSSGTIRIHALMKRDSSRFGRPWKHRTDRSSLRLDLRARECGLRTMTLGSADSLPVVSRRLARRNELAATQRNGLEQPEPTLTLGA